MAIPLREQLGGRRPGQTSTAINNAEETELYNRLMPRGGAARGRRTVSGPFTVGGVLTVSGLEHTLQRQRAVRNIIKLENTNASFYTQVQMVAGTSQVNL